MSANVVSMFYSGREVPWHGLGTQVDQAPTSKDAITLAGLDWDVVQKDVIVDGNVTSDYKANVRSDTNELLGIVTPKYKIVQNAEAFEFTDSLIGGGNVRYETAGVLKDSKVVWLLAKLPTAKVVGEDVEPYICFTNNHDGKGAVRVCMTPIRVVCNNTLNLALSSAKRMWSTVHMGNLQAKLAEAKHTLQLANDYMTELDIEADKLANKKISDAQLEAIFDAMYPIDYNKDSQRKITNIQDMKNNFFKCLQMPDINQFRGTVYGAIMAATDQIAHIAPARMTDTYQANNWGKIMNGHPYVDEWYKALK